MARVAAWQRAATGAAAVRRLKLARFGDNMRDVAVTEGDKVEAQLRFGVSVNTYGVNELVAVVDEVTDAEVDKLIEEYAESYEVVPELAAGGERHESLRYGARLSRFPRISDRRGFGAFTTNFQDLGGLRQLPGLAVQRLMADGYGFGGEGDWKTSVMLHTIKAMGRDSARGTSFMEDYTYHWGPDTQDSRCPHARGLPEYRDRHASGRDPSAEDRRPGGSGPTRVRRRARSSHRGGDLRSGRSVPAGAQRGTVVPPDEPLPKLP